MNDNLYSNGVRASGRDFSDNVERIRELLASFQLASSNFRASMEALGGQWAGSDYDTMKASVKTDMDNIAGDNGTIPEMMKRMIEELEQTARDYSSIQKNNESHWG